MTGPRSDALSKLTADELARSDFAAETTVWPVPLTSLRVHDGMSAGLPSAAANDDMGLITGTPGTSPPTLQGVDFGATSTDEKAAFLFVLPPEYTAGQAITLRAHAGMLTTVSDGTATLDCEAWKDDGDGTSSADCCATAAQDINSLTLADIDFTLTPTGLVAGDVLQIRLSFGGSDTGDAGVMIPTITAIEMRLTSKG